MFWKWWWCIFTHKKIHQLNKIFPCLVAKETLSNITLWIYLQAVIKVPLVLSSTDKSDFSTKSPFVHSERKINLENLSTAKKSPALHLSPHPAYNTQWMVDLMGTLGQATQLWLVSYPMINQRLDGGQYEVVWTVRILSQEGSVVVSHSVRHWIIRRFVLTNGGGHGLCVLLL